MTSEEINEMRKRMGNIKIRGKDAIRPIFSWFHAGLNSKILRLLSQKLGFKNPFPI